LEFDVPDRSKFPCLDLAYRALRGDDGLTAVLNDANEVAVTAFLEEKISFTTISILIEQTMDAYKLERSMSVQALKDVRNIDRWARKHADSLISELEFKK
jgi:1-deoxy-D-xylulose-5-phosphate reductoisomerase